MDSSSELQSSDNEFWNDLEIIPQLSYISKNPSVDFQRRKTLISGPPSSPGLSSPIKLEKLEKQIDHIRLAKEQEIEALKIIVRNNTRKELQASVEDIIEKCQEETKNMKEGYDGLKVIITNKEKTIQQLGEYLADQAMIITEIRIDKSTDKELTIGSSVKSTDKSEVNELKKENKLLKVQLEALREVCGSCQKDTEEYKKRMIVLKEANDAMQRSHEDDIDKIRQEALVVQDGLHDEIDKLKYEMTIYKEEVNKEFVTRDLITIRQRSFIASLQEELRNAKIVLQNPRMRNKMHEKLKDYMEENEKTMSEGFATIRSPIRTQPAVSLSIPSTSRRTHTA